MKIVLGADLAMAAGSSPAVELLKRLRFNGAQTDVVHVVPPPIMHGVLVMSLRRGKTNPM